VHFEGLEAHFQQRHDPQAMQWDCYPTISEAPYSNFLPSPYERPYQRVDQLLIHSALHRQYYQGSAHETENIVRQQI
jgi:hypothetical protein